MQEGNKGGSHPGHPIVVSPLGATSFGVKTKADLSPAGESQVLPGPASRPRPHVTAGAWATFRLRPIRYDWDSIRARAEQHQRLLAAPNPDRR